MKNNILNEIHYIIYGGLNKNPEPFKIGDKIKQKYCFDENNNIVENGSELFEFIGYKDKIMLLKPLNDAALYGYDTVNQDAINKAKEKGFKPDINKVLQLHVMYADRFIII